MSFTTANGVSIFDNQKQNDTDVKVRCNINPSECNMSMRECKIMCGFTSYVTWTYYLINKSRLVKVDE